MKLKLRSEHKFDAKLATLGVCSCSDAPDPPDYGPMAAASKESAEIMAALGRDQLDFAKQQYEEGKPFYQDLARRQVEIMGATADQGRDYYDYLRTYRPVERSMLYESMGLTPIEAYELEALRNDPAAFTARLAQLSPGGAQRQEAARTAMEAADRADAAIIAGQDQDIYNTRRAEIEHGVSQAIADSQGGYTRAINQAIRQGLRYGASPQAIASNVGATGLAQASSTAAAANAARAGGIQQQRGLAQTNMALRRDIASNVDRQKALAWARKLDTTGLVRGLPGASQGAYGLAVSSGNSAGANAGIPGQQYMQGMAQGANTIGQGRQLYQQGMGNILNAQTSIYNANPDNSGEMFGTLLGGGLSLASRFMMPAPSDRRLKTNIVRVGTREDGIGIYEYEYLWDDTRYVGVMADEVERVIPAAVVTNAHGFKAVNYAQLGV